MDCFPQPRSHPLAQVAQPALGWSLVGPILLLLSIVFLTGCGEQVTVGRSAGILVVGDSMLSSNRLSGNSVAQHLEGMVEVEVTDRSVPGARYFYALPITGSAGLKLTSQYRANDWDAIIVNGGGNDLLFGCGCGKCDHMLDRLISPNGKEGAIPNYVTQLASSGAHVIYLGYLRNPGTFTPIKSCGPAGNELDRRLNILDKTKENMTFISLADLVPAGNSLYHQIDRIHPSSFGSSQIAKQILKVLQRDSILPRGALVEELK
jgi:acyl-CoA thioesterase I